MFEYHGWVKIREGSNASEDNSDLLRRNCKEIATAIKTYNDDMGILELYDLNSSPYVRFDGERNHYRPWVLDLFIKIGEIAKGSHGLLYIRDDESSEFNNEFQAWRMARGKVSLIKDTLLSPCDPVIETY